MQNATYDCGETTIGTELNEWKDEVVSIVIVSWICRGQELVVNRLISAGDTMSIESR